jgi:rare lipoprotein A (peptidoglycan hydrolase)
MGRTAVTAAFIVAVVTAVIILVSSVQPSKATPPTSYRPVDADEFVPVTTGAPAIVDLFASTPRPPRPRVSVPVVRPKTVSNPQVSRGGSSITGKASWYCKAGVSICHHGYPPGSMVAAACAKLRTAMGPNWRGKTVIVSTSSRSVIVTLVDRCGSSDKLIDLYNAVMVKLGGTGVLQVTVRW